MKFSRSSVLACCSVASALVMGIPTTGLELSSDEEGVSVVGQKLSNKSGKSTNSILKKPRKLTKKKKNKAEQAGDIEGKFVYGGCGNNFYRAEIKCGIFSPDDQDLCLYEEFAIGSIVDTGSDKTIQLPGGGFFLPEPTVDPEEPTVDPEKVCLISGTFRKSTMQGDDILPIPLATSNGCQDISLNFLFVLKATVMNDGNLDMSFSRDGGKTFYTDDVECPLAYVTTKAQTDDRSRRSPLIHGVPEAWFPSICVIGVQCGFPNPVTNPISF